MRLALLLLLLLLLASTVPCQQPAPRPAANPAQRLVRELELPERRPAAVDALLALGASAVPALLQQARHPDLQIARSAFAVLAALGHDGLDAVPALRELAKGDTPHAQAAAWTLARLPWRGTFLVPTMNGKVVRELDADGKEVWRSAAVGQVWAASMLANGNLLVAEMTGVREVDPAGKVVWKHDVVTAYTAERLLDGNTLFTSFQGRQVGEVDASGKEVWTFAAAALHATRLPDGRTLTNDYNAGTVFEVGRDGQVGWKIDEANQNYGCVRLPDGRTLVLDQHRSKGVFWARDGKRLDDFDLAGASCWLPLPDGSIRAGNGFVRRCNQDGSERWKVDVDGWVGRITLR